MSYLSLTLTGGHGSHDHKLSSLNLVRVGVCDMYIVCNNIVIVVLTMCNLTLSSIVCKNQTKRLRSAGIGDIT